MTEQHECEWEYAWVDSPEHHRFVCRCGEFLEDDEVERRLNEYETPKKATEALSAEMARQSIRGHELLYATPLGQPETQAGQDAYDELVGALQAYADILDGKDG